MEGREFQRNGVGLLTIVGNCVRSKSSRTDPDFLLATLERFAYAAFFTESRTRLFWSTELHRKSGYRPRLLSARAVQIRFWTA
jgi:hypothetical protein